jgi:hypothetical protein
MVVVVDCARARPHPSHDRPSASWQWLAAAAPRPALAGRTQAQPGRAKATADRTEAAPSWPRKNGAVEPRPGRAKKWSRGDLNPQPCCLKTDELPLCYILFYDWCFWYMSFTLYVVPRQNNIKMMRQWGFEPWPPRTWSIISPLR